MAKFAYSEADTAYIEAMSAYIKPRLFRRHHISKMTKEGLTSIYNQKQSTKKGQSCLSTMHCSKTI